MATALAWTPQALEDLLDIYLTIGIDNQDAAERVHKAIEDRVSALALFPIAGPHRIDMAPTARVLIQGMYLALY